MVQIRLPENSKIEKGNYYKDKTGECQEHSEPKNKDGGCAGMGCEKNCKTCFKSNTCK